MMSKEFFRKSILLALVMITIFLSFGSAFANVYPAWHDVDQPYRTPYNITWSSPAISNLTVNITINSSSMGPNFNFSEHKDSLRVVYFNTSTNVSVETPHYALSWDNSSNNASIQFLANELKASTDTTYWLYYGSLTKTDSEDYCGTFIYCDEFDDGTISSRLVTTDQDGDAGTIFDESDGVFNLSAGGADIWTGSDEYGALYVPNVVGDIDIRVGILAQQNTNAWAKAGPVIKNDMTAAGSSTGYAVVTKTISNGYSFQRDNNNNGFLDSHTGAGSPAIVPSWMRLTKAGTSVEAFYSKVDAETWTQIGSTQTITSIQTTQDAGLIVTSHSAGTLSKVEFDNFTIRRLTTNTYSYNNGAEEELANIINTTLHEPTTLVTTNIVQNDTFLFNMTVYCTSFTNSSCGNVSSIIQYNTSATGFSNISNVSGTTPLWVTNTDTPWCVLDGGESCSQSWTINATGTAGSNYLLRAISFSNVSEIVNYTTGIPQISIIAGNSVRFNQTTYDYGTFTRFTGDRIKDILVESDNGNNTNIAIACQAGDCGSFSDNWSDTTMLDEGDSALARFRCLDNGIGPRSAIFNLTSAEYDGVSTINLTCNVDPVFGPLSVSLINPIAESNNSVLQNLTLNVSANISCEGICGNVSTSLFYSDASWWNDSFIYRTPINVTTTVAAATNYQVLVTFNSSTVDSRFDWNNNCQDIRFINGTSKLDYYIETCNTTSQEVYAWVELDRALSPSETYNFDMYYGSPIAVSESNVSNTFRNDEIFLVSGRCTTGAICDMDNAAEVDTLRQNINQSTMTVDGTGYVTQIDQGDNPYGTNDNYYTRYRTLFIPSASGDYEFGTRSDDDSEISIVPYDSYGHGINATEAFGDQDVVTTQYGTWHQNNACGSGPAVEGTRTLVEGQAYWIEYVMVEGGGGEDQLMCISVNGSSHQTFNTANFGGEFFARNYVTAEPVVSPLGAVESPELSTTIADIPFYTLDSQPQNCILGEGEYCIVSWLVNATGPVNTTGLFYVYGASNYTQIATNNSREFRINITDNVIPTITLYEPADAAKLITNGTVDFVFLVDDNDLAINCSLFVDSVFITNTSCSTGVNTTITYNAGQGYHSWYVTANDSDTNSAVSATNYYTAVLGKNASVIKSISSIAQNMYLVTLNITNYIAYTFDFTLYDFVDTPEFAAGSFNSLYNFTNSTDGSEYNGTVYGWNLTLESNESRVINYSIISSDSTDYSLIKNWPYAIE